MVIKIESMITNFDEIILKLGSNMPLKMDPSTPVPGSKIQYHPPQQTAPMFSEIYCGQEEGYYIIPASTA
jgi:hypothetical protein